MKKIQFVFILLLLLPFTGCKSVVKETVVEKPVVVEKSERGVFFHKNVNGIWRWVKNGNEKTDSKYVGEIRNGIPNGQGTFIWIDGTKYEGEWKDGKENGQGTWNYLDGGKNVGEWKDGKPWNISKYDKNGNIYERIVNGVKQ